MENLLLCDGTLVHNMESFELDIFALNMVQKNSNDNLLVSMKYSKEDKVIFYNIDGLIPLSNILENSISGDDTIELLSKICDVIKYTKLHMLYSENLVFDIDYIFLDNKNSTIKMLYNPVQNKIENVNIRNFFKELMLNVETDDYLVVSKIFKKINKNNFNFDDFMNFLKSQNQVFNYELIKQSSLEINEANKFEENLEISGLDDESDIDINAIDDEEDFQISGLDDESDININAIDDEEDFQISGLDDESDININAIDDEEDFEISGLDDEFDIDINAIDDESDININAIDDEEDFEISGLDDESDIDINAIDDGEDFEISGLDDESNININAIDDEEDFEISGLDDESDIDINAIDDEEDFEISGLDDEFDIDINTMDDEEDFEISGLDDDITINYQHQEMSSIIENIENTKTIPYSKTKVARIIREKDGTSKIINKANFVIGKSENTDFRILNNKYVSKIHATIITRGTDYYIVDNGSSNGTFVNNEYIEHEVKLKNNDIIILATTDEKIRFCLE